MDSLVQFARAQAVAVQVIGSIRSDQLALPTPCSEWSVHDILNHILDGNTLVQAWIRGEVPPRGPVTGDYGPDPVEVVLEKMGATWALITQQGMRSRPVTTRMGEFSVGELAEKGVADTVAHLWDLAIATGQPVGYDPELVAVVQAHFEAKLAGGPREGKPVDDEQPVPEGATAADRLAGFLGRTVPSPAMSHPAAAVSTAGAGT